MTKKQISNILLTTLLLFASLLCIVYFYNKHSLKNRDYDAINKLKLIRVAVMDNVEGMSVFSDSVFSKQYLVIKGFSEHHGFEIERYLVKNFSEALEGIDLGRFDVVAGEIPVNDYTRSLLSLSEPIIKSRYVLVQQKNDTSMIRDISQMMGKTIWAEEKTPARLRIDNICSEQNDTIYLKEMHYVGDEELIRKVSEGKIEYAVCHEHIARQYLNEYPNIDISVGVGFIQSYSLATHLHSVVLSDSINKYIRDNREKL